jgi:transcriptional regulator with XRE-family HTH domain
MSLTTSIGARTEALVIHTTFFASTTPGQPQFEAFPGAMQLDLVRDALAGLREYIAYAAHFEELAARRQQPSGFAASPAHHPKSWLGTSPRPAEIFGERIRNWRNARGVSLRELAERSGVSAPMLSQVERGETSPTLAVLFRIAGGLGVEVGQLVGAFSTPSSLGGTSIASLDYKVLKIEMRSPLMIALHVSAAALTPATVWALLRLARAICRLPPQISADRAEELRRAEEARLATAVARRQREEIEAEGALNGIAVAYADELQRRFPNPDEMAHVSDGEDPSEVDLEPVPETRPPDAPPLQRGQPG